MKHLLLLFLVSSVLTLKFLELPSPFQKLTKKSPMTVKRTINGKTIELPEGDKFYVIPLDHDVPGLEDEETEDSVDASGYCRYGDGIVVESKGKFGMVDLYRRGYYQVVHKFLKDLNVKELEFVIFSHQHMDHRGDLDKVHNDFKVKALYLKDGTKNNFYHANYNQYVNFAKAHNIAIKFVSQNDNKSFTFENLSFEFHNRPLRPTTTNGDENGNTLTALATSYQGKKIYLSGDIERRTIKGKTYNFGIDAAKEVGKVDVYKVAHHGNWANNNLPEEIKILSPKYSVMTIDSEMAETTKRLKAVGSKIYRAGVHHDGIVIVNIDPAGVITIHKTK